MYPAGGWGAGSESHPASPGEFDLAGRERPAAKPAAMELSHHGIDLLGNFRAVVCLTATVADVRSGHP